MTIQHIWDCTCGAETPCEPDDTKAGAIYQCPACRTVWCGVRPKHGGGVKWIPAPEDLVEFHDLMGKRYAANINEERLMEVEALRREVDMDKSRYLATGGNVK